MIAVFYEDQQTAQADREREREREDIKRDIHIFGKEIIKKNKKKKLKKAFQNEISNDEYTLSHTHIKKKNAPRFL